MQRTSRNPTEVAVWNRGPSRRVKCIHPHRLSGLREYICCCELTSHGTYNRTTVQSQSMTKLSASGPNLFLGRYLLKAQNVMKTDAVYVSGKGHTAGVADKPVTRYICFFPRHPSVVVSRNRRHPLAWPRTKRRLRRYSQTLKEK